MDKKIKNKIDAVLDIDRHLDHWGEEVVDFNLFGWHSRVLISCDFRAMQAQHKYNQKFFEEKYGCRLSADGREFCWDKGE